MRKRVSRPARFAAIDNTAVDTIPSILATGLLTHLIRAKDGDDVTVESLAAAYDEGDKALSKAMRVLVEGGYVVKFKVQRAVSELVTFDDGTEVTKRGGSWYTTFTVDSVPFTREDVSQMLDDITAAGNARKIRVEPGHLDPRTDTPGADASPDRSRPTSPKGDVGEEDEFSQVGPTPPLAGAGGPGAGGPTPGRGGAHKKTVPEDSLSSSVTPDPKVERETASPEGAPAPATGVPAPRQGQDEGQRQELLEMLLGLPGRDRMPAGEVAETLLPLAVEALTAGWTIPDLRTHLARSCDPDRAYAPTAIYRKHLTQLPTSPQQRRSTPGPAAGGRAECPRHPAFVDGDCPRCRAREREQHGTSGPAPVDGAGLLARLRASQPA